VKKVSNRLLITSLYSAFAMLVNSKYRGDDGWFSQPLAVPKKPLIRGYFLTQKF
jgi:hypothetical protein